MNNEQEFTEKEWNVYCSLERLKAFCELIKTDMERAGFQERWDYINLCNYLTTLAYF